MAGIELTQLVSAPISHPNQVGVLVSNNMFVSGIKYWGWNYQGTSDAYSTATIFVCHIGPFCTRVEREKG